MIRILQCVNNMHRAGLETVLMNYYRSMDREKIQFDFLTHRPQRDEYDDEIESLGGRVYHAPRLYPHNYPAYFAYMRTFFREHPEYRIMHSHIDSMSYLPLLAGRQNGIPVRIAHSHSTSLDRDLKYPLKQFFRRQLPKVATHNFACGQAAGEFLFRGQPFTLIPNAIEPAQFAFQEGLRQRKRGELALTGAFVVGHVGRLSSHKNQMFLIETFEKLHQAEPDAVLLLIGSGEMESALRSQAKALGLQDCVRFLGSRSDVRELYQAMDVFVLPSLFEGVPMVGVEAQFSGLPCVLSTGVPREVCFTESCRFLPLEAGPDAWASEILSCRDLPRGGEITNPRFDMGHAHTLLEEQYLCLYQQTL